MKKREPTLSEIADIAKLSANEETVLVGGMAVSVLAAYFHTPSDIPLYTKDADFVGGLFAIEQAEINLRQYKVRKYVASLDEASATPNFGKLAVDIAPDIEAVEIDFLYRIDGMSTDEIEQKAITIELGGKLVRVIHPILSLEHKINNLALYPAKRNASGIGQAEVMVRVVNTYLDSILDLDDPRSTLQAVERIARFAARESACFAFHAFGVDVLESIPGSLEAIPGFGSKRLPQIRENIAERRQKFTNMWERMSKIRDPGKIRFRL